MQKIDFEKGDGLVPVIVQDYSSREVLMVAYMNKQAWEKTKKTGRAHYYSRSRKGLWQKGEESGNFQEVKDAFIDCDSDTLLLQVRQIGGAACHEGYRSCFFRKRTNGNWKVVLSESSIPRRSTRSERVEVRHSQGKPGRDDHRALQEVRLENLDQ
jgi:phosphoribosyl-AMP cyclohydrolase